MGYTYMKDVSISMLKGLTLKRAEGKAGDGEIEFETVDGRVFRMYHDQDCCESVYVEDIVGTLQDLVGSEILEAEEVDSGATPPPEDRGSESYTWTFYKLGTRKGSVTIRWFGESNGYYSERVGFAEMVR